MAQLGMDVDAVETAARELKNRAAQLAQLTARLNSTVSSLPARWEGNDARRFTGTEWPGHKAELNSVHQELSAAGDRLLQQAREQREASSAKETTSGGSTSAGGRTPGITSPQGASEPSGDGRWWDNESFIKDFSVRDLISMIPGGGTAFGHAFLLDDVAKVAEGRDGAIMNLASNLASSSLAITATAASAKAIQVFNAASKMGGGTIAATMGIKAMSLARISTVATLGKLAIDITAFGAQEAAKADWSPAARKQTFDYAAANPRVVVEEVGKATVTVAKQIVKSLWPF